MGGGSSSWNNDGDGTTYQQQQQQQESLDIEAPTRLDRDKFASAFARFLGVPLIEEDEHDDERMGRSGVGVGDMGGLGGGMRSQERQAWQQQTAAPLRRRL